MNCLQAQAMFNLFIDDKLEDDQLLDFIKHIKNCPHCQEELEVYYTLLTGMKQLDAMLPLSNNFSEDLWKKINKEENEIIKKRRRKLQSNIFTTFCVIVGCIIVGISFKNVFFSMKRKPSTDPYYIANQLRPHLFYPPIYQDIPVRNKE